MQTIRTANRGIIRLVGARTSPNRIKLSLDAVPDDGPPYLSQRLVQIVEMT
jgi:hypothetical protein